MVEQLSETGFAYDVNANWEQLPTGMRHSDVAAVGVDSQDRVFLFVRYDTGVLIYDRDGKFLSSWGEGVFTNAHGLTVGPDDSVYCVDNGDHSVRKFSPDGELLMTLGNPGHPSDTGHQEGVPFLVHPVETVKYPGKPFNRCTNLAVAPNGDLYVADGYGNCRVHRFSADGKLLGSWGEVGAGPGQFYLPHGIGVGPDERVYVCDRENDRIQIFQPNGEYLMSWTDVQRPDNVAIDSEGYIYVAELWRQKNNVSFAHGMMKEDHPSRVTIFDRQGSIVARWGASTIDRGAPGNFIVPHDIAVDSHGDIYVAEVIFTLGIKPGFVGPEHADHQIQKFTRLRL